MATKKRQRDGQKQQRFGKDPPPALRFCLFVDKDGQPPVFELESRQKIESLSKNVALHKTDARNCAQCTIPGGRFIQFLRGDGCGSRICSAAVAAKAGSVAASRAAAASNAPAARRRRLIPGPPNPAGLRRSAAHSRPATRRRSVR